MDRKVLGRARVVCPPSIIGDSERRKEEQKEDTKNDLTPITLDGAYDPWTEWGECSVSCGGGTRTRNRTCTGASFGGKPCEGSSNESEECTTNSCPVDGYFSEWSGWSSCSVTCADGSQTRDRLCVEPLYGGRNCSGAIDEMRNCTLPSCPVDGIWAEWTDWGQCDATCDYGNMTRNRTCMGPFYAGKQCEGSSIDTKTCFNEPCKTVGVWLEWGAWGLCSVTCGGGERLRYRNCSGDLCEGNRTEANPEKCHDFSCYPLPLTCSDLIEKGMTESREVEIDPTGIEPFWVRCNMVDDDGIGIAEIVHDHKETMRLTGSNLANGIDKELKYNVTFDQMDILVSVSLVCRQYISWQCRSAPITDPSDPKTPFAYWGNKDDAMRFYWGGVKKTTNQMCACGETESCVRPELLCNCDANDDVMRVDAGYITSREDVPIRSFHLKKTDGSWKTATLTIGPMQCIGTDPLAVIN
ncbi:hypothetical protein LSAT2_012246 [Lamellibrachia satsuma]|nr:hypothetical protein LSAT2_012246 [Lamellibrachia satsuma]